MLSPFTIFQIHYKDEQKEHLDKHFIPYDNKGDSDPLLEFNVFRKIHHSKELNTSQLWGALSWKFTKKTGLTGKALTDYLHQNPGYDVYYCNPFPEFESLYQNIWVQGETAHPEFIQFSQQFFDYTGLTSSRLLEEIQHSAAFATTNSFIATSRFWQAYIDFIESIFEQLFEHADKAFLEQLYSSKADAKGVHAGANYLPFIVERLFSLFLGSDEGKKFKAIKYPVSSAENKTNIHLKHLKEMKDAACATRSNWMASCWLNYRNLYLTQRHGVEWAKKYLPLINPKKIIFSDFPIDHK